MFNKTDTSLVLVLYANQLPPDLESFEYKIEFSSKKGSSPVFIV